MLSLAALVAAGCPRRTPAPVPEPAQPPIAGSGQPAISESRLAPTGSPRFEIGAIDTSASEDGREIFVSLPNDRAIDTFHVEAIGR